MHFNLTYSDLLLHFHLSLVTFGHHTTQFYAALLCTILWTATTIGTLQQFLFYWKVALKSRSHGNYSLKFLALNGFILTRAVKQLHRATNDKAIKYVLRDAFEVLITRYRRQVKARVKRLNSFLLTMAKTKIGSIARHKVDKQVSTHSIIVSRQCPLS